MITMMRLMIRCRTLKCIERGTFGPDPPPHLLTGGGACSSTGFAPLSQRNARLSDQRDTDLILVAIPRSRRTLSLSSMINNRHLILASHRRVNSSQASSSSSPGFRGSGSLKRNPVPGIQHQQLQQQQVRRTHSLGTGSMQQPQPATVTYAATPTNKTTCQRMQFIRSHLVASHPLLRGSDHLCLAGMTPSAISSSPASSLLMQEKSAQSPLTMKRNKSSMSSSSSGSEQECSNSSSRISTWAQGRMRLLLFSFLFAFVPAIMHFRRTPDSKGSMGNNKSTGSRIGAEPDSESSSGSDNESSDEAAVQVSYQQTLASEVEVLLFKLMPLKLISRIWGWINSVPLPAPIRVRIISWYSHCFECNLLEAGKQDLREYANLGDFFKRELRPGSRPIESGDIVSPADGTLVHFGRVDREHVEQVKGVKYSLPAFLGPQSWNKERNGGMRQDQEYHQRLLSRPGNVLYHCVIYLAPGDYHRFHSPAEWTVRFRRHFSGKLISIRPTFMSWIEDLFTINERVAYIGKWAYGFFSMTAVGATNVGSVRVYFDEKLKTNQFLSFPGSFKDQKLNQVSKSKGDAFGEFNLGSTIVLIFEAPGDFECNARAGQKIRYGQKLFSSHRETKG